MQKFVKKAKFYGFVVVIISTIKFCIPDIKKSFTVLYILNAQENCQLKDFSIFVHKTKKKLNKKYKIM